MEKMYRKCTVHKSSIVQLWIHNYISATFLQMHFVIYSYQVIYHTLLGQEDSDNRTFKKSGQL